MPIEVTRAVGLFADRRSAETALVKLRDSGFDMNKISVVNKNTESGDMKGARVQRRQRKPSG